VRIGFSDFWGPNTEPEQVFTRLLSKHFDVEVSRSPDYLFHSVFSFDFLDFDGVRIFYSGENWFPDFNLSDYAMGFEWLELGDRYLRLPVYVFSATFQTLLGPKPDAATLLGEKTGFCSFVYSNKNADPRRAELFHALSGYRRVDSGGRTLNNVGHRVEDKLAFARARKFAIAYENSSAIGYTTEKLVDAMAAGTIPIYFGNPEVGREFNPRSFVNVHDFPSFDAVVAEVARLDRDDRSYVEKLSQPWFEPGRESLRDWEDRLERFLVRIVSQPPAQALRRNRGRFYDRALAAMKYGVRTPKLLRSLTKRWVRLTRGLGP
jgi:hypothetical protein